MMNVVKLNGIKVYNLTTDRSLPEWASRAEKRKLLAKDPGAENHIELIHELEMPDASTFITCSPDQKYLFLLGRYKPRVRCYELGNLSMKFDRCVDYLPTRMTCLSDDYSKFALLEEERWIDVHAAGGHHFRFRVPRPGIDIHYTSSKCHLLIPSIGDAVYRMDLCEGRFAAPLLSSSSNLSNSYNASCYMPELDVLLSGTTRGVVYGWDLRSGEWTFNLDVCSSAPRPSELKTFARFSCSNLTHRDPLNFAVGTAEGLVHIYDIRQTTSPWHTRDTEYRRPIKTISFHDDKVLAVVAHCLKIWNIDTGKTFVGFETGPFDINWMYHFPKSGLIMLANESPKVSRYFIPLLGEAPHWCSYLDQLITEVGPDVMTMYDGYKFLTRQQLLECGMMDLVGTRFLRAYMHGYFVSNKLFMKIQEKINATIPYARSVTPTNMQTVAKKEEKQAIIALEMEEAAEDKRFSKLKLSKMTCDPANSESDLIRIHQARLEKKRQKKELRKARATRANALIQGKD
ncbi:Nucleolar protein 10 [Echinococcus granulosus]|nr:Nucleolar protein 10 [Echinococcus granulosus]